MNCPNCGHENPDGNAFCEACGNAIAASDMPQIRTDQNVAFPSETVQQPSGQVIAEQESVDQAANQHSEEQTTANSSAPVQPKKSNTKTVVIIVFCVLIAAVAAFVIIHMQQQSNMPVVYGTFEDSRPASDDHGQFLSFNVEEDTASSDSTHHYAIITAEWVPGKYDLDGYEVELENDRIDIKARVMLQDNGNEVTFTPYETLSAGVDWNVSGSFDHDSVTLREGSWTIKVSDGMQVPVLVDNLVLPYSGERIA